MTWHLDSRVDLGLSNIAADVAARQQATAAELCRRLNVQPGVVLADEVGMGKTFVALAVAASAALAEHEAPVVVMVPTGVAEKWVKEWAVFTDRCLAHGAPQLRVTETPVRNGTDFLRLLDDPPHRRRHLIVVTHGALSARLGDPWVQLAFVRHALRHQRDTEPYRKALARWSGKLLREKNFTPEMVTDLLASPPKHWRRIAARYGLELDDDPVPEPIIDVLDDIDLSALREAIWAIPFRQSAGLEGRLKATRKAIVDALKKAWPEVLGQVDVQLPLLILDEAHHVKNDNQLARLFANPEAEDDAEALFGPLGGMFDRMLFLTATPFQLGHGELLRVLERFEGVRWELPLDRVRFRTHLAELRTALDTTQAAALRLERAWGRLEAGDDLEQEGVEVPDRVRSARAAVEQLRDAMEAAEVLLRPWVARHMRAGKDQRRTYLPGASILHQPEVPTGGIPMSGDGTLPFLLATRAQVLVGLHGLAEHRQARAFFADGLASSFEAYRFTRRNKTAGMDDRAEDGDAALPPELAWYLDHIDRAIPSDGSGPGTNGSGHPKVEAVVERTAQLWAAGEKVVLFCFYVETGKALRAHLSRRLRSEIARRAASKLGTDGADEEAVFAELGRIGDRIEEAPLRGEIEEVVRARLDIESLTDEEQDQAVAIVRRFLRTPSFLARFVDLPAVGSLSVDLREPIIESLERPDGSGSSMADKIARFGATLCEMVDAERTEVLESLTTVTTGDIHDRSFDPGEVRLSSDPYLPNVRLANGSVPPARRRTLMLGFNSPFFPEVLIASAVMAEGVDLHLECRHVIHHDLDWSPSTLEQRTGRLDRIASKAERIRKPIEIYEPYLAGMYDEKVYRVVKDRDRWFNVVMGEQIDTSEWATERAAERVPLPASLAAALTFDLAVVRPNGTSIGSVATSDAMLDG